MTRLRRLAFCLLVLVGSWLTAVACSNADQEALDDVTPPTIVRIGWQGAPDTLNPGAAYLTDSYTIFNLVYDTMYELTLENTFALSLAENVTTSADGKTWTFTIRSDATWHDGVPLTARDIAFTYNFYRNHPDFPYLPAYTEQFAGVTAPDDTTVVIDLIAPIPNMEAQLVFMYVLPEHIWSAVVGEDAAEFTNEAMIGSGPFRMLEYRPSEFVRLGANDSYFGERPKVDEVIFQTFEAPDSLVQALQTGQVDLITELPKTTINALRNNPDIAVVSGPPLSPEVSDIILNQLDPALCPVDEGGVCTGHPALRDRVVRQALAHATDKQAIIDVVLLGLGTPGRTLIPDSLGDWFNSDLVDYAFDIRIANRLLDEAGYLDVDGNGVREMPDGETSLTFRVYWTDDTPEAARTAGLIADNWEQIGVRSDLRTFDADALLALCCPGFDFDIIIWGWTTDPDPNPLLKVMTTDVIPVGSSETGYSNPVYDALYTQQATTLDREARRQLVWEMQRIVFEDVAYIVPYYNQTVQAYRTDRFQGWLVDGPMLVLEDQSSLVRIEKVP